MIRKILYWLICIVPLAILAGKAIGDTCLTLISVIFLMNSIIEKNWSWLEEKWVKVALGLWLYTVIRSLFVDDILYSLAKSAPWIRFIIFAAAMQDTAAKQDKLIDHVMLFLTIAVSFLAADSIFQFYTGHDILGRPLFDEGNGTIRLTGPYSKKIVGSVIAALSAPVIALCYNKVANNDNLLQRTSAIFLIVTIFFSVFISGERSSTIQISIIIFSLLLTLNIQKKYIISIISLIAVIVVGSASYYPALFEERLYSIYSIALNFPESVYGKLWISGIRTGLANPIFGVGTNYFETSCQNITDFCRYHPHNIFIEWFAELGAIGLIWFVYLLFTILKQLYITLKLTSYDSLKYLLYGAILAILIKLLPIPSSGFFKNWYAVPFWFMLSLALAIKQRCNLADDRAK